MMMVMMKIMMIAMMMVKLHTSSTKDILTTFSVSNDINRFLFFASRSLHETFVTIRLSITTTNQVLIFRAVIDVLANTDSFSFVVHSALGEFRTCCATAWI